MRIELVGDCPYCEAKLISKEDCSALFGHSHGDLCCVSCCCMGSENIEEEEEARA